MVCLPGYRDVYLHRWRFYLTYRLYNLLFDFDITFYLIISIKGVCRKTFEHLIYNELFTFFTDNNLISPNQSGFRPGDSCANQLIAITHEIYKSFDDRLEVRGVFLDISKAFDKVWHEGLLLKLSLNGISRNLLKLLRDFLYCRKR